MLFAASPGELARIGSQQRTALFSDELLHAIARTTTSWPPDAARIADHTERRLAHTRAGGALPQHPPYLWQRIPTREGVRPHHPGIHIPRLSLQTLSEIVAVMLQSDELAGVANLQKVISLLPVDIRGAVPYAGTPQMDLIQLLRTCQGYAHGREALVSVLGIGMANGADRGRVLAALDEFWPA